MTSPRHPIQLRRATLGYLFSQIAGATRKCTRIYGPTLWKIPLLRLKTWRNSTATAYFGPACRTHECDTRKSAAKQTNSQKSATEEQTNPRWDGLSPNATQADGDARPYIRIRAAAPASPKCDGTLRMPRQK